MRRSLFCGVCNARKIERNGRLVCPPCSRRYAREAAARNGPPIITDAVRATKQRYRNKVRPSGLTNQQVYSLKKRYGLSEAAYLELKLQQGSRCAICEITLSIEVLVDHDHQTDTVRGLLCRACNFGLGLFDEDVDTLRKAATYLERHEQEIELLDSFERKESA